ncbi:(2Fe-2S)-binding protein [Nitrospirillum iridis]|uniref:Isoquinoline 1-oxidoreductase alpha subunit n=1 Tax=Nitrospirillum iridis TaxID=765888 RepID=A0A7X0EDB5_9PROT|nr:(2Fe-2S)-binding protein [Nitrospirillum iridis]MBB6250861.1 isoquinoline 1-oxidoreductase alpha subunit [Nitrospirillum iridis]
MITFSVNGREQRFEGDPDMPLLWYLRDIQGLTGTKFGCGEALCGACTVHADGAPIRSCQTTLGDLAGMAVTTIEGLSPDGMHPVQVAWRELNVAQCGYCQAGQIMSAAALLKDTPHPTDEDIDSAMGGNICRCATYPRIRAAIKKAAGAVQRKTAGTAPVKAGSATK